MAIVFKKISTTTLTQRNLIQQYILATIIFNTNYGYKIIQKKFNYFLLRHWKKLLDNFFLDKFLDQTRQKRKSFRII